MIVTEAVTITTTGGTGSTQYSSKVFDGYIHGFQFENSDLTSTGTITLSGETNGITYWNAITATTGNVENYPREVPVETSGASTALAGQDIRFPISNERVKITLAGLSTGITSGTLRIFVEGAKAG